MTLQQFRALTMENQIDVIKRKGVFLYLRQELGIDIVLYQLDGFYTEVFFDSTNTDTRIKSFDETESLEIYLKNVNISELQYLL